MLSFDPLYITIMLIIMLIYYYYTSSRVGHVENPFLLLTAYHFRTTVPVILEIRIDQTWKWVNTFRNTVLGNQNFWNRRWAKIARVYFEMLFQQSWKPRFTKTWNELKLRVLRVRIPQYCYDLLKQGLCVNIRVRNSKYSYVNPDIRNLPEQ